MAFTFYSSFCKRAKRGRKISRKNKETKLILKSHISGPLDAISLKFGMWSTEVGGHVHSKNCLVSSRKHRATWVQKLHFCSFCQYTDRCCAPASWTAQHTTVCLDIGAVSIKTINHLQVDVNRSVILLLYYLH